MYRLKVLTLENNILFFTVSKYYRKDGTIDFIDEKTNLFKSFPIDRVTIEEVAE